MKEFLLLLLVLSNGALFSFAQSETTPNADWKTFAPVNEEFSVEIPVSLKSSSIPPEAFSESRVQDKNAESRRYLNSLDGTYFYIFSDDRKTPGQYKYTLRFANDQTKPLAAQNSDELTTQKFQFDDPWDYHHVIVTVKGINRVYVFHTVSPVKENALVERYFKSIKLNGQRLGESTFASVTEMRRSVPMPTKETGISAKTSGKTVKTNGGTGRGSGIGNGTGSQNAPENKTPTLTPTPSNASSGVKILTKPRADYTDYARFYEITGKIVLRVTFSANSSIGAISTISGLPFGLTEQAILAARGITFEPAMRAGVPYAVTKPVEYQFVIY
jgi:hypothetical protein